MNRFLPTKRLRGSLTGLAALAVSGFAQHAVAHPHVYVTAQTTVNITQGAITSFDHVWTFDEMYTAMAVEGLDKNNDKKFDREELAELAKLNVEGLKEFKYFTQAMLGQTELDLKDPQPGEYWLEHKDGILSMHFRVGLEKPVLTDAANFSVTLSDPSFFIAITLAEKDPVKLNAEAPKNCKAIIAAPNAAGGDAQKLNDAFAGQLGANAYGFMAVKAISVTCS